MQVGSVVARSLPIGAESAKACYSNTDKTNSSLGDGRRSADEERASLNVRQTKKDKKRGRNGLYRWVCTRHPATTGGGRACHAIKESATNLYWQHAPLSWENNKVGIARVFFYFHSFGCLGRALCQNREYVLLLPTPTCIHSTHVSCLQVPSLVSPCYIPAFCATGPLRRSACKIELTCESTTHRRTVLFVLWLLFAGLGCGGGYGESWRTQLVIEDPGDISQSIVLQPRSEAAAE